MKRTIWSAVAATTIAVIGIVGGAYYYFKVNSNIHISELQPAISWRAQIYLRKASGRVPELSWSELLKTTTYRGGFSLQSVIAVGQSVSASLSNPYTSREDREAGSRIFEERCARCHGLDGRGALGPSLAQFGYKRGDSDLSIYRILTDGIPGTAMVSSDLSFVERWQVIGYLRTLQFHSNNDELPPLNIEVSSEQIRRADDSPGEWLTYSGSLNGWRYSRLSEITPANVSQLHVRWIHQSSSSEPKFESTPLVVGDTIFATEPPATVLALDAKTGEVIWQYQRPITVDVPLCCGVQNRGLAILDNSLFFGSLDGYLIAINANTGKVNWQTRVASPSDGFSMTGAPLVVNHSVVVGVAGGRVWDSRLSCRIRRRDGPAEMEVRHHSRAGRSWPRDVAERSLEKRWRFNLGYGKL